MNLDDFPERTADDETRGDGARACARSVGTFDEDAHDALQAALAELGRGDGENRTGRACWLIFIDFGRSIDEGLPLLRAWNARRHEPHEDRELVRRMRRALDHKADARRGDRVIKITVRRPKPTSSDLVVLSDVKAERLQWLWHSRIPFGKITVLDGDPGLGKSTVTMDIAARVTRGERMPEDANARRAPADVVMMSAEDGPADTIRPRADAARADVARIRLWMATRDDDGEPRPPSVGDCDQLERIIRDTGAVLVVIDPFVAYLPDEKNSHNDHDMRRVMAPLAKVADDTRAAIVLVRHLKKSGGDAAIYKGGGSIGITGAARSVLLIAKDRGDETGLTRILASVKSNVALEAPALRYQVVDSDGVGRIEWMGVAEGMTADELVAAPSRADRASTKTDNCADWLRHFLEDGPKDHDEVVRAAGPYSYSDKVLRRARERLGVVDERHGRGRTRWRLPGGES